MATVQSRLVVTPIATALVLLLGCGKTPLPEAKLDCLAKPQCTADQARAASAVAGDSLVLAADGSRFYRGIQCEEDCADEQAGFAWSYSREIAQDQACAHGSEPFQAGCRAGVEAVQDDRSAELRAEDDGFR